VGCSQSHPWNREQGDETEGEESTDRHRCDPRHHHQLIMKKKKKKVQGQGIGRRGYY
jgi:hypothetical protein